MFLLTAVFGIQLLMIAIPSDVWLGEAFSGFTSCDLIDIGNKSRVNQQDQPDLHEWSETGTNLWW